MKTIHEILSDAFREIKEQHGVALETADFNVIRTMAGDAHHGLLRRGRWLCREGRNNND